MEPNETPADPSPSDVSGLIALRAYQIWQQAGCPDGQDVQNWLQAECEICSTPPRVAPVELNSVANAA